MSGGGTGGHVNPAIAIADTILHNEPDSVIEFTGTPRGIENKLVPAAGYVLHHIEIQGLRRSLSPANLKVAYLTVTSVGRAKKLLREFKPDIVIGTGGFVCWPVLKAASQLKIPSALHESNAVPGLALKMLEGSVDKIFVNFEETISRLKYKEKAERVGNPLRGSFASYSKEQAREILGYNGKYRHVILSCGGSMGAERINQEIISVMKNYTCLHPEVKHIHATGSIEYKAARTEFESLGLDKFPNLEFIEYIYDMPQKMAASDLVINRAGAMTLSELSLLKKPCILIPSPNVTDDHQYKNAATLGNAGAAVVFRENELKEGLLQKTIEELLSDRARMNKMGEMISSFSINNCNNLIYSSLKTIV